MWCGCSKATLGGIHHTGFHAKPGMLESPLVARGDQLSGQHAARVNIPAPTLGAPMIALDAGAAGGARGHPGDRGGERLPRDARGSASRSSTAAEPDLVGVEAAFPDPGEGLARPFIDHPRLLRPEALRGGCEVAVTPSVTAAFQAAGPRCQPDTGPGSDLGAASGERCRSAQ